MLRVIQNVKKKKNRNSSFVLPCLPFSVYVSYLQHISPLQSLLYVIDNCSSHLMTVMKNCASYLKLNECISPSFNLTPYQRSGQKGFVESMLSNKRCSLLFRQTTILNPSYFYFHNPLSEQNTLFYFSM